MHNFSEVCHEHCKKAELTEGLSLTWALLRILNIVLSEKLEGQMLFIYLNRFLEVYCGCGFGLENKSSYNMRRVVTTVLLPALKDDLTWTG